MLELGSNSQLEADLLASVDGHDLSLAGLLGTLVANNIGAIGGGSITDIGSWVGGELDGVVLGDTGRLADVFELGLSNTANNVGVEKVMGGSHLGDGAEDEGVELHSG